MRFFTSLYNSLYNFKWLRDQRSNTAWAWSYFFLLIFFVAGLNTITIGFAYLDKIPSIKKQIVNEVPEFQAVSKDGQLQVSGLIQPYIKNYQGIDLVVNTIPTATVYAKDFVTGTDKAVILIAKDRIEVYNTETKEVKTETIKDLGDFTADRAKVLENADKLASNKTIAILIALTFVALFVFLTVVNLLNVLFFSTVVYFITKRKSDQWKFKEVFQVGLFAISFPMILTQFGSDLYVNGLFAVVFGVWMYFAVLKDYNKVK